MLKTSIVRTVANAISAGGTAPEIPRTAAERMLRALERNPALNSLKVPEKKDGPGNQPGPSEPSGGEE